MNFCVISDSAVSGFLSLKVKSNFHCHSQSEENPAREEPGTHGQRSSFFTNTYGGGCFSQAWDDTSEICYAVLEDN